MEPSSAFCQSAMSEFGPFFYDWEDERNGEDLDGVGGESHAVYEHEKHMEGPEPEVLQSHLIVSCDPALVDFIID